MANEFIKEGHLKFKIIDSAGKQRNVYVKDFTGMRINRLTVLYPFKGKKRWMWKCKCDCGKSVDVFANNLIRNHSTSCGCVGKEKRTKSVTTHGLGQTREYGIWYQMITRCHNPSHNKYNYYGGRGISVCKGWRDSFENFYRDMGLSSLLTLDRIDNDGNYSCGKCDDCLANGYKSNCRWASRELQSLNKRDTKLIEYNGEKMTLKGWSRKLNFNYATITYRLKVGVPFEKAISLKNHKRQRLCI